jgi:hypothetical protein
MKKQKPPPGWTEKGIRELAAYYDSQTEQEQAAEIEAALKDEDHTVMVVPTKKVPDILKLLSENPRVQRSSRASNGSRSRR